MLSKHCFSAFALAMLVSESALAQQFSVQPASPILLGESLAIELKGLPPNKEVVVRAERVIASAVSGKRALYRSEATFVADASGAIDFAKSAAVRGSYVGVDPRGLFWSMNPSADSVPADRAPLDVWLAALGADGASLADASVQFISALPNVKTEKVEAFPGAIFASQGGPGKRPAIILLGGSEGGSAITRAAAPLASHGFAVLALPYYSPADWQTGKAELPALPAAFADIPVERLNLARAWLQARSDVDATRIAIHGTSKGAEFALLAGVHLKWPTAIVAIVPTDVVWEGWGPGVAPGARSSFSINGKPIAFVPYKDFGKEFEGFQKNSPIYIRRPQDLGRSANPAAAVAARIAVEQIKAAVMVVGGHDDQTWASGMMAQNIAERRAEAKLETLALIYPKAGHYLSGNGYNPTTQYNADPMKPGGTPRADAQAQGEAWPQAIAFLKKHLMGAK